MVFLRLTFNVNSLKPSTVNGNSRHYKTSPNSSKIHFDNFGLPLIPVSSRFSSSHQHKFCKKIFLQSQLIYQQNLRLHSECSGTEKNLGVKIVSILFIT